MAVSYDTSPAEVEVISDEAPPVEIGHAIDVLKHLAGLHVLSAEQIEYLDFDGDGEITINDAIGFLKVLAGLITIEEIIEMAPELEEILLPFIETEINEIDTDVDTENEKEDEEVTAAAVTTSRTIAEQPPVRVPPQVNDCDDYSALFGLISALHDANNQNRCQDCWEFEWSCLCSWNWDWGWGWDWELDDADWAMDMPTVMVSPPMPPMAAEPTPGGVATMPPTSQTTPPATAVMTWAETAMTEPPTSDRQTFDNEYAGESENVDFSDTNNQVEGVQESDIVKTDGRFIYVASTANRANMRVSIISALDGEMETTARIQFPSTGQLHEMLLYDGKLIVIWSDSVTEFDEERAMSLTSRYVYADIYDTSQDFSEPYAAYSQEGWFSSARMIDNNIYLITNFSPNLPRVITEYDYDIFVPNYSLNGECWLIPPPMIVLPEKTDSIEYTVIGGLDVYEKDMLVSVKAIFGRADTIYSSMDNIYVIHGYQEGQWSVREEFTVIDKFAIDSGWIDYTANTTVRGAARNQFHFDEHNGILRVVTEVWGVPAEQSDEVGTFTVLERPEDGGWWDDWGGRGRDRDGWGLQGGSLYILCEELSLLSSIHRIGWGENVHSVRFMGDIGYVVTFWQVDPLFSFDLSDPLNPVVLDELKIPGFSRYMHSWSDGLLLGMGVDTNDRGIRTGLKMTMFDVSDNEDLIERHVFVIEDMSSWWSSLSSAVENDHRAALVSPGRNIIGFPYFNSSNNRAAYAVFSYDYDGGFRLIGEISNQLSWSSWGMEFNRGLFIGDYIYAISDSLIVSAFIGESELVEIQRLTI
jgi:uncharacterized secreted protein with C-terminal beta-propeller domain